MTPLRHTKPHRIFLEPLGQKEVEYETASAPFDLLLVHAFTSNNLEEAEFGFVAPDDLHVEDDYGQALATNGEAAAAASDEDTSIFIRPYGYSIYHFVLHNKQRNAFFIHRDQMTEATNIIFLRF
ncbi:hypothetical protein ACJX0J_038876 [Zea mays]